MEATPDRRIQLSFIEGSLRASRCYSCEFGLTGAGDGEQVGGVESDYFLFEISFVYVRRGYPGDIFRV
jgi:hypothetical protein